MLKNNSYPLFIAPTWSLIVKHTRICEGDTPFLVRSIQGVFRRYAVHKNPVISYAVIYFYF